MTVEIGDDGRYHPRSEAEVADVVRLAREQGRTLRVLGSGHSIPAAIAAGAEILVVLDQMRGVRFDDASQRVWVEAGCHLGRDPGDATGQSTWANGLVGQLQASGWALPDLGGILHQTVGGFLSTGSMGGSVKHSLEQSIQAIRFVDGNGDLHELRRSDNPGDPFFAAGVSLGLLGVITGVQFQARDRYTIRGEEWTRRYDDSLIDLFGPGDSQRPSTEAYLRDRDFSRILWWPQAGVRRVVAWEAAEEPVPDAFRPRPHKVFPPVFGSQLPAQLALALFFRFFDVLNPPPPRRFPRRLWRRIVRPLHRVVANRMLASGVKGPQRFHDHWYGLAMDDRINYRLLPLAMTELWIPLERAQEAMIALRDAYEAGGYDATGTHACEIYAAPASEFWMSPGYERASLRVDPLFFGTSHSDPAVDLFPRYWDLLRPLAYRPHWGKHFPDDPAYLRDRYPRWDQFLALREQYDPHEVFVTPYWRRKLAL